MECHPFHAQSASAMLLLLSLHLVLPLTLLLRWEVSARCAYFVAVGAGCAVVFAALAEPGAFLIRTEGGTVALALAVRCC